MSGVQLLAAAGSVSKEGWRCGKSIHTNKVLVAPSPGPRRISSSYSDIHISPTLVPVKNIKKLRKKCP
jgi:hypothetical protein